MDCLKQPSFEIPGLNTGELSCPEHLEGAFTDYRSFIVFFYCSQNNILFHYSFFMTNVLIFAQAPVNCTGPASARERQSRQTDPARTRPNQFASSQSDKVGHEQTRPPLCQDSCVCRSNAASVSLELASLSIQCLSWIRGFALVD